MVAQTFNLFAPPPIELGLNAVRQREQQANTELQLFDRELKVESQKTSSFQNIIQGLTDGINLASSVQSIEAKEIQMEKTKMEIEKLRQAQELERARVEQSRKISERLRNAKPEEAIQIIDEVVATGGTTLNDNRDQLAVALERAIVNPETPPALKDYLEEYRGVINPLKAKDIAAERGRMERHEDRMDLREREFEFRKLHPPGSSRNTQLRREEQAEVAEAKIFGDPVLSQAAQDRNMSVPELINSMRVVRTSDVIDDNPIQDKLSDRFAAGEMVMIPKNVDPANFDPFRDSVALPTSTYNAITNYNKYQYLLNRAVESSEAERLRTQQGQQGQQRQQEARQAPLTPTPEVKKEITRRAILKATEDDKLWSELSDTERLDYHREVMEEMGFYYGIGASPQGGAQQ